LNLLDVPSLRAADCDSDHYLVVAKVRERLAKITQISYGELQSQEVKQGRGYFQNFPFSLGCDIQLDTHMRV
jgi:hypothetical protein